MNRQILYFGILIVFGYAYAGRAGQLLVADWNTSLEEVKKIDSAKRLLDKWTEEDIEAELKRKPWLAHKR